MTLPEEDFAVYDQEDSEAQLSGVLGMFESGHRVVDLGAGRGRIALPLAEHGVEVLAVDQDESALMHRKWSEHANLRIAHEDFLASSASWMETESMDGVICLGNTLNLISDPLLMRNLFHRAAGTLSIGGSFLIDDFPVWGPDLIRTQWPLGISPDRTQQVVWASGGESFAYRTGSDVDSDRRHPKPGERLLRAWTMAEFEIMARESGFRPGKHHESALMIRFVRSD